MRDPYSTELVCLVKKEEEVLFSHLESSLLLQCFFMQLGALLVMKTLKDEWHIVTKAY